MHSKSVSSVNACVTSLAGPSLRRGEMHQRWTKPQHELLHTSVWLTNEDSLHTELLHTSVWLTNEDSLHTELLHTSVCVDQRRHSSYRATADFSLRWPTKTLFVQSYCTLQFTLTNEDTLRTELLHTSVCVDQRRHSSYRATAHFSLRWPTKTVFVQSYCQLQSALTNEDTLRTELLPTSVCVDQRRHSPYRATANFSLRWPTKTLSVQSYCQLQSALTNEDTLRTELLPTSVCVDQRRHSPYRATANFSLRWPTKTLSVQRYCQLQSALTNEDTLRTELLPTSVCVDQRRHSPCRATANFSLRWPTKTLSVQSYCQLQFALTNEDSLHTELLHTSVCVDQRRQSSYRATADFSLRWPTKTVFVQCYCRLQVALTNEDTLHTELLHTSVCVDQRRQSSYNATAHFSLRWPTKTVFVQSYCTLQFALTNEDSLRTVLLHTSVCVDQRRQSSYRATAHFSLRWPTKTVFVQSYCRLQFALTYEDTLRTADPNHWVQVAVLCLSFRHALE